MLTTLWFPQIETAAVKIGESDILEVTGYGGYLLNGVESGTLPGDLAGFAVTHTFTSSKKLHQFKIDLGDEKYIEVRAHKDLVSVKLENAIYKDFGDSKGLMGDYNTGEWLSRNGSVLSDENAFGFEWQVQDIDPKLFANDRHPQYPAQCIMPKETSSEARRLGTSIALEAAEEACEHWGDQKDQCVFDVMATGDLEIADAGAF